MNAAGSVPPYPPTVPSEPEHDAEGTPFVSSRPTSIPRFDVADYARRCDDSIRGSIVGALPPLGDLALRHRARSVRERARTPKRMGAGFAALLQSFVDKSR